MTQSINLEINQAVARLTLNKPPLNIINLAMMAEMMEAIESLKEQPFVRVLVIDAVEGSKIFSAGVARQIITLLQ